jgi:hypothetical protein
VHAGATIAASEQHAPFTTDDANPGVLGIRIEANPRRSREDVSEDRQAKRHILHDGTYAEREVSSISHRAGLRAQQETLRNQAGLGKQKLRQRGSQLSEGAAATDNLRVSDQEERHGSPSSP